MQIAVLAYHASQIHRNEYGRNDHVTLERDLTYLCRRRYRFVPATVLVRILRTGHIPRWLRGERAVVLTCDDGTDYDFRSLEHEVWGPQPGFLRLLRRRGSAGRLRGLLRRHARPHMTAFVIASPEARAELDQTCLAGVGRWNDHWWRAAVRSGYMHIGNHSWDHLHKTLSRVAQRDQIRGSFHAVTTHEDAERQIRDASRYIASLAPNPGTRLFAYPFGHVNDYLARDYLPGHAEAHGIRGAFTTVPEYTTPQTDPYVIPRFVCGEHWREPAELERIVAESAFPR